ncbi:drug resistance transporter, EmrB/QacA subfamily [Syntrophobotulus glycolicus DSM 8271]|uniref:Drug resistance transporter, EmrB/QacA subfamily n=1 Tax=Syntrophobotulus glycolicus (strain DSM 8271 / FlGlyR) TaxID=645991 RepID=F0T0Z1_SYNGF|nr:MFS transporter [Syntrophobotulus glycolicus]ADY57362.1 drug resistance transporter, EmrB/QacA subfamily [Syntrophobotulus glycolicus DSM 8271]
MDQPRTTPNPSAPVEPPLSKRQRSIILFAVAAGTFMAPLDSSVVNIALPSIAAHFQESMSTVQWVILAYLLIISSLLLAYGRLGDLYGHKKIYMAGFVIFTLGSLFCGISFSVHALIFFRALQAIGAGMLMSMGPAIITNTSLPQERGKSLGIIAISVSVALSVGPVLGGFLTAQFGWQSIFLINIPVGIAALVFSHLVIPNLDRRQAQPFDAKGALLLFIALISILFPLNYADNLGWASPVIWGLLLAGIILLVLFVLLEKKIPSPMIDLSLFTNRLFTMGNLSALLNYMALFSVTWIMPFYLQEIKHLSPSAAGLMLIPMPLTTMIIAPLSGSLSDKFDTRYISSLGMGVTAIGLFLLSRLEADSSTMSLILSFMIVGLGSGMFQAPNNSAVMGTVAPNRRGIASSMLAMMRNIGMSFGVAISGAVFAHTLAYLNTSYFRKGLSGAELTVQSFIGALHITFIVGACFAAAAIFTSFVRGPLRP